MKGQAQIVASVLSVIVVSVMVVVGLVVYGTVTDVTPHDRTIINETMCTTCVNGTDGASPTTYNFVNTPILNDTTLVCLNDSINLMTNGPDNPILCLGYNVAGVSGRSALNITNTTLPGCQVEDVVCTYTFDEANTNEQSFYDNNTTNTFSGFTLLAILAIVLAAVGIMMLILLMRG